MRPGIYRAGVYLTETEGVQESASPLRLNDYMQVSPAHGTPWRHKVKFSTESPVGIAEITVGNGQNTMYVASAAKVAIKTWNTDLDLHLSADSAKTLVRDLIRQLIICGVFPF